MPQQVIEKLRSALKPDPDNPRKQADEEYIDRLAADIKLRGVLVPLITRPDDVIIDGWCRWLAALKAHIDTLPCIVTMQTDPGAILAIQMATVMHRADISGYEKWQACERLRSLNPNMLQKEIAVALSLSDSMIVRLMAPSKCTPAWQNAFKDGTVGTGDIYCASKLPLEDQDGFLSLKLSGQGGKPISRDSLEQAGRKKRNGNGTAVSVPRLRCALRNGIVVQFTGEAVSLESAIEAMKDLTAELRIGISQGLDSKTVVRVLADKAKAKGVTPG